MPCPRRSLSGLKVAGTPSGPVRHRRKRNGGKATALGLAALLVGAAGCFGCGPVAGETKVSLSITSVEPYQVVGAVGTPVSVVTQYGCTAADVGIKLGAIPIAAATIVSSAPDHYELPIPTTAPGTTSTTLTVTCAKPAKPGYAYLRGGNTATAGFLYNTGPGGLEPPPMVDAHAPVGDNVPVQAQMQVTFTRPMLRPSVEKQGNVGISGIAGKTTYDPPTKTATFVPDEPLDYSTTYACVVEGGDGGVISMSGRYLQTHLAPPGQAVDPDQDAWTFETQCQSCGSP